MARSNKFFLKTLALCLALTSLIGCTNRSATEEPKETNTAQIGVTPSLPESAPPVPETSVPETPEASATPTPTPAPEYPDLTAQPAADDEFFSDAAFLGNSLVDGFRLFSGLNTCDYYCATSMTVAGADDLINQMAQKQYGKIYILLGINEIGYDVDYFIGLYQDMLDDIREKQPDAELYIMGLTPVSAYKSANSDTFNMDRVRSYNDALRQLAADNSGWYVDLCAGLAGSDGYLPSNVTTDGVHFAAEHYKVWLDYLKTHYNPVEV
ncbi:MAG: GDSL-type esterase/lipase family protein [Candidatus Heteroscillospira sp.]